MGREISSRLWCPRRAETPTDLCDRRGWGPLGQYVFLALRNISRVSILDIDMTIELGEFGIFRRADETTPEVAREIERLGFGALWLGGSPSGDLESIERLLDATESIPIATGIVNMWRDDARTVADSYHRVSEHHPGRFLLGVGIGHPEATSEYRRPLAAILEYLAQLEVADVPKENLVLAALGPKVLAVAAEHTRGAHPYLTTPRHTRLARGVIGDSPLLAPEQTVVVEPDREEAREIGGAMVSRYLRLVNYRNNLLREGWTEPDLINNGSDQLIDELVLAGTPHEIVEGLRGHLSAGADHVSIQTLGPDPVSGYRALAEVLFNSHPQ